MRQHTTIFLCCLTALFSACSGKAASGAADSSNQVSPDTVATISQNIWSVFQDSKNDYWFSSDGEGVFHWNGKILTQLSTKLGLAHDRIRGVQEDRGGTILINTIKGVCRYDGKSLTTLSVTKSDSATAWAIGADDLLFPASQETGGVCRYDGKNLYHMKLPKSPLEDDYLRRNGSRPFSLYGVYTIYKDERGAIWFGTSTFGACRFDGKAHAWLYEDHLNYIPNGGALGIRAIIEDRDCKFWFTNNRYRYSVSPKDSAVAGRHYVAYSKVPGAIRADGSNESDFTYYQSVIKDNKDRLWMGTYQNGVFCYDGNRMKHYPVRVGTKNVSIVSMYKDKQGQLWLATQDAGVMVLKGDRFEVFSL